MRYLNVRYEYGIIERQGRNRLFLLYGRRGRRIGRVRRRRRRRRRELGRNGIARATGTSCASLFRSEARQDDGQVGQSMEKTENDNSEEKLQFRKTKNKTIS